VPRRLVLILSALVLGCAASSASAQSLSTPLNAIDGPPAPIAPAVVARDADGRTTVRATRIAEPIVIDGRLDEPSYQRVVAIADFVQQEPEEGEAVTEKTEVWLFFDDRNVYVSARCWDSHPERQVANEMRRDGQGTNDNESFAVVFDTFFDRRNGFLFQTALAGGLFDGYITDERDMNRDWNTVWDARTARFDEGWTVEMAIPFKSLRFRAGRDQIWGVNFKRVVRWKNEMQYLTRIPAALGRRGINKLSSAGALVGIEPPQSGRNFEVKPYGITGLSNDHPAGAASSTDREGDVGFDVKLGLTDGLTADFTYNTDFAQVEEDEQQVNLTRFSVLFPEKRDFFLEGQGIFSFGGVQARPPGGVGGGGGGGGGQGNPQSNDVPIMFFSRSIGLSDGVEVPIDAGGRVTGKAGAYSIGLIDIRTGESSSIGTAATNFGVLRVKRDILRRSAIGVLYTDRSVASTATPGVDAGASRTVGVDGVFSFFENLSVNTYLARTGGENQPAGTSYRAQLDYNADRYGLQLERLSADEHFKPDVGFLRRAAFIRNSAFLRFSPRPTSLAAVRKFTWDAGLDYITNPEGRLESRELQVAFRTELQNGDTFSVEGVNGYESLVEPFPITTDITIPVGSYGFPFARLQYGFGPQRKASGFVTFERGSFYDGTRTAISTGRPRVEILPQLTLEPSVTVNWVKLPAGDFTNTLVTTRASYALSPRMAFSALVQYNSGNQTFNTNARLRWEYRPGSDLFVVYTDNRDTTGAGFPELRNRGIVVKLTRLFRM
jgi:hypothetical protein